MTKKTRLFSSVEGVPPEARKVLMADRKPMSLLQWIIFQLGGMAVSYPIKCDICGTHTKGNIITGFYLSCENKHQTRELHKN